MLCDSNILIYAADPDDTVCSPFAEDANAIIAATALAHDLPMVTRNVDDFKHITRLKLFNPFAAV